MTAVSFEQQSYVACSLKLKLASAAFRTPQTQNGIDCILEAYCQCVSPRTLYRLCHVLTNVMFQPVHIVRLDERTLNLFILAGHNEEIEIEIRPDGSIEP